MHKSVGALKSWALEHLRWFGLSAFQLRTDGGKVIFIDPFRVPARAGTADLILVTHPHPDHYDRKAIKRLKNADAEVILPRSCAESGQKTLSAGETLHTASAKVTGVAAYNRTRRFHPRSSGWLGYVIDVEGIRLYHAGDTDLVPEMADLRPDIALLPVGGIFSMNVRTAADAAVTLKASLCIPMHFGVFLGGKGAGRRFVRRLGAGGMELSRG